MVKLVHHEMPVNKTLHHRKIEILAVLTLLIGSLSFLFTPIVPTTQIIHCADVCFAL